jgi:hypothetical protein
MNKARKCTRCGLITQFDRCACGSITKPIRDHNLRRDLSIDVTLTLRFDYDNQPFILVQKPSGQARIPLQPHDLIHV